MTVIIKVGRRLHRNIDKKWFRNQISKMKNTLSVQQHLWNTITYGFKLSIIKMNSVIKKKTKDGTLDFSYTKKTYKEEESLNYNIEWYELILKGSEDFEKEEYEQAMKFFSKIEELPIIKNKNKGTLDPELTQVYSGVLTRSKKYFKKGFDKAKTLTIAKTLNDIGIIVLINRVDNEESIIPIEDTNEKN